MCLSKHQGLTPCMQASESHAKHTGHACSRLTSSHPDFSHYQVSSITADRNTPVSQYCGRPRAWSQKLCMTGEITCPSTCMERDWPVVCWQNWHDGVFQDFASCQMPLVASTTLARYRLAFTCCWHAGRTNDWPVWKIATSSIPGSRAHRNRKCGLCLAASQMLLPWRCPQPALHSQLQAYKLMSQLSLNSFPSRCQMIRKELSPGLFNGTRKTFKSRISCRWHMETQRSLSISCDPMSDSTFFPFLVLQTVLMNLKQDPVRKMKRASRKMTHCAARHMLCVLQFTSAAWLTSSFKCSTSVTTALKGVALENTGKNWRLSWWSETNDKPCLACLPDCNGHHCRGMQWLFEGMPHLQCSSVYVQSEPSRLKPTWVGGGDFRLLITPELACLAGTPKTRASLQSIVRFNLFLWITITCLGS